MKSGIYCFENKINGKRYIGQSKNIDARLSTHVYMLNRGTSHSTHLQSSWNKYGEDNFDFYVIEYCPVRNLNKREKYWVKYYNTFNRKYGYNLTTGGDSGWINDPNRLTKRRTVVYYKKYLAEHLKFYDNICLTKWGKTLFELMDTEILELEQINTIDKYKKFISDYSEYDLSSFSVTRTKRGTYVIA